MKSRIPYMQVDSTSHDGQHSDFGNLVWGKAAIGPVLPSTARATVKCIITSTIPLDTKLVPIDLFVKPTALNM